MIGALRYADAVTAVQAGIGRLISDSVWEELLKATTVNEIISGLDKTAYGESLMEEAADLPTAERQLRCASAHRFRIAMPFLRGNARKLIDWLWRLFEMDHLIIVLRGIHNQVSPSRMEKLFFSLGQASPLDWKALAGAGSISRLIERLGSSKTPGGFYARALDKAMGEYQRQGTAFVLEVSLYLEYFRALCRIIRRLIGRDRHEAARLVGSWIGMTHIMWALRYRIHFDFSPETIMGYTAGGCTNLEALQKAAHGAPVSELVKEYRDESLPEEHRFSELSSREAVVELEVLFNRRLYRMVKETLSQSIFPYHLGTIIAYGFMLKAEVSDLISLMEGVAQGWRKNRIQKTLNRY